MLCISITWFSLAALLKSSVQKCQFDRLSNNAWYDAIPYSVVVAIGSGLVSLGNPSHRLAKGTQPELHLRS